MEAPSRILDRLLPAYDFRTRYTRRIAAPPNAVWDALHAVTAAENPITRLLMSVRTAGRSRMSGRLADIVSMPDLGRDEGREAVKGQVAKYWRFRATPGPEETNDPVVFAAFAEPGWAKGAMSFQLTAIAEGTLLAAETRVRLTDPASRRVRPLLVPHPGGRRRPHPARTPARGRPESRGRGPHRVMR